MILTRTLLLLAFLVLSRDAAAVQYLTFSAIQASDNSNISEIVLREAYRKIGIHVFISPLPAKRSLHHANEGLSDGELFRIAGMEKTFKNLIRVPVPINYLDGVVMTRKASFDVQGWDSLKPYTIAIRRGVKFSEAGTAGMKQAFFNTNMSLGRILLEENKIDIAVIARVNGLKIIQQLKEVNASDDLRLLEPPLQSYPLYHYLHKRFSYLIPKLTTALKELSQSGRIAEIRKDYLAKAYPSGE